MSCSNMGRLPSPVEKFKPIRYKMNGTTMKIMSINHAAYANFKNEVFLQLGSVRPSVGPYETVRSFSLISAC